MNRWLAALVLMCLAGCGGASGTRDASPAKPAEPAPSASPSPSEISTEQAAQQYLALTKQVNEAGRALNASLKTQSLPKIKAAAGAYLPAVRTFSLQLQQLRWPPPAQAAVDSLVEKTAAEIVAVRHMIAATSLAGMNAAVDEVLASGSEAATEVLRERLGLPSAASS